MKLPVVAYGNRILRQKCTNVSAEYESLNILVENMWETMVHANGCGLAAPQIGKSIKLFIVDSKSTYKMLEPKDKIGYFAENDTGILETFINSRIISRSGGLWEDEEGCLSIPGILQKVSRHWSIKIEYYNKDFERQLKTFAGYTARVIQHEYDHTEGILYIDHINRLSRRLIDGKLKKIAKGQVQTKYLLAYKNK